jgi:hypothetical protein
MNLNTISLRALVVGKATKGKYLRDLFKILTWGKIFLFPNLQLWQLFNFDFDFFGFFFSFFGELFPPHKKQGIFDRIFLFQKFFCKMVEKKNWPPKEN